MIFLIFRPYLSLPPLHLPPQSPPMSLGTGTMLAAPCVTKCNLFGDRILATMLSGLPMRISGLNYGYFGAEILERGEFWSSFGTARGKDKGLKNPVQLLHR
jgi:hypothetical protein